MAKGGYVGKILYVDLTDKTTKEFDTADYEQWGGGHGIGSALFFELVKDKTIDGYDPDNLVTFMTGPMSGTLAPSASGRTEIQGIGIQQYPIGWFSRSNFGGRFAGMLKYAGFDGIAVQGKSETPVWLNIIDGKVTFEDATDLWGLDTHETQEEIWKLVTDSADAGEWYGTGRGRDSGRSTQRPAVVCIGPAGENLNRTACVIHDSGNGGGQIGFGGILGSKNLKAISTLGTGSVAIADPAALMDTRLEIKDRFGYNADDPYLESPAPGLSMYGITTNQPGYGPLLWAALPEGGRPQGCMGCFKNCRMNHASGLANGDICVEGLYWAASGNQEEQMAATTLLDRMGTNVYDYINGHDYMLQLYKMGILGPGKEIDTDLPFDKYNTYEFIEKFTKAVAHREGIGDLLAEGMSRAAVEWGRYEEDTASGLLNRPQWGFQEHYDPRLEVEWSYGSLFGDRDINEHGVNWHVHWMPLVTAAVGQEPHMSAEQLVTLIAESTGVGDPDGWDYSEEGIYGDAKIKAVSWHRHYSRFFIQSALFCDWAWPMLVNYNSDDPTGATPEYEIRLLNAVTGNDWTYEKAMEVGRKIWNLDRAIWVLQGRTREMEVFQGYVYDVPTEAPYFLPVKENGEWSFGICLDRTLDREKFESVKDRFYALEGWDQATGWPTRATLDELGLGHVADELDQAGKLGAGA